MSPNVGVNVLEVDGLANPTIAPAPTSIAGFVGLTERGPLDTAVRVSDVAQFRDRFGANRADGYLGYAVEGFFQNGGREAWITRVAGAGSRAATVSLNDRATAPAATLRLTAGFRGLEDPGAWGERIRVDVRDDPRGTTTLSAPTTAGATSAVLASLSGVRPGVVLRLADGSNVFFRRVRSVDPTTRAVTWAGGITPVLNAASASVTTAEFRLIVRFRTSATAAEQVVEDWRYLSMETDSPDYAADRINHRFTGSRYVVAADVSGTTASGEENPVVVSGQALAGSVSNAVGSPELRGDAAARTGLHAFDGRPVQLIALPDAHTLIPVARDAVTRAALDYCAGRGDCMYVGAAPDRGHASVAIARALSDYTQLESDYLSTVKAYSAAFQAAKAFGALYAPWIRVADPTAVGPAPSKFVPPDGHVMGLYARTDLERGVWKAPAGSTATLRGALEAAAGFTDVQHTDLVRNGFVNGVRFTPGLGITVAASRTLSTDTRWWYVGTRLLFNFVKSSLRDGLRFVRQEPHSDALRRTVKFNVVEPFLLGLWRRGAFGADPAAEVFSVKCDAENNPPTEVELGNFWIEVFFYPVRPAETVMIVVGQQPSGASAGEA